jgi:hypothetical protein
MSAFPPRMHECLCSFPTSLLRDFWDLLSTAKRNQARPSSDVESVTRNFVVLWTELSETRLVGSHVSGFGIQVGLPPRDV